MLAAVKDTVGKTGKDDFEKADIQTKSREPVECRDFFYQYCAIKISYLLEFYSKITLDTSEN